MKILVTGGAGFIGSHIADALLDEGHTVVVMDDLSSGRAENVPDEALFLEADIRDAEVVARAFDEHGFDVVCHQAAQTSVSVSTREPIRDAEINILGSLNLLEQCRAKGIARFVFASTGGAIYGEIPEGQRAGESWPPQPISPYACSKLAFERYLRAYHHEHEIPFTILRYANVYGPRQDPHGEAGVVAIFSRRLVAGEPVQVNARREVGDPGCIRDYVYVKDVVRANALAIHGELTDPVLNVGTGVGASTLDLVEGLEAALDVKADKTFGSRRAGDLERSVLEPNDQLLALQPPTPLAQGMTETARWFAERG
ncbi:MAG TPA: SDR family NAD(P)-dependent oxidoreductase [Sandaracinaceae bacterium LLY-WYZ-13_1]|nr:SDR family NAD(P)-dependent oxidoreductase [Sandaracinaceae bacterium LLY-WYZ-13_1]